jgi:hypothetical protein
MFRPRLSLTSLAVLFLASFNVHAADKAQTSERLVPGTLLHVQTDTDAAMKVGAPVRGHLVDPVYVDNHLTIPAGERITGHVIKVVAAPSAKRRQARWQGDFTPLHEAHIQFDQIALSDGSSLSIVAKPAKDGVQMLRIEEQSVALHQPSLPKRLWAGLMNSEKEALHSLTAPGKIGRLKKYVYHQLPYHPESVEAGFDYDVELVKTLNVPVAAVSLTGSTTVGENTAGLREASVLHARLENDLSSGSAKPGLPITAVVTQPLYDSQHRLAVPQGTLLLGAVSQASPAAKHGRSGVLRFAFREMQFPAGFVQTVRGATHSVDTNAQSNLQLDAEGSVSAKRPNVVKPMVTALLATTAITDDESSVLHSGAASNGFSLVGRIVGIASGSRYVAAGIGAYTTGREVYARYIATGKDIHFPLNTRIEIAVDPVNSPVLKPQ